MEVIIGREAGAAAPRLCLKVGNVSKYIGETDSVPKSVSRSHCRLEIDDNKKITVSNISDQNSLFVNGMEYKTKIVSTSDLIELGPEKYRLDLNEILSVISVVPKRNTNPGEPQTYKIKNLKKIWEDYTQAKLDIQIRERKVNALSAIPGVISMISIALSFIDGLRAVFIAIAAIFALTFALVRIKSAGKVPLQQKELDEKLQDNYVCPHCKHFLGNQRYELVLRNGGCPWCKSKFTE